MSDDDLALDAAAVDTLDKVTRREAARMRADDAIQAAVARALDERGMVLHPEDPAWRKLEQAFIAAQRSALSGIQSRLAGEIVPTPQFPQTNAETLTMGLIPLGKRERHERKQTKRELGRGSGQGGPTVCRAPGRHAASDDYQGARATVPGCAGKSSKAIAHKLAELSLAELLKQDLSQYEPRNGQTINKSLIYYQKYWQKPRKMANSRGLLAGPIPSGSLST